MSVSTEITRIKTNIGNAYSAAQSKGAIMPMAQVSASLANTISSITTDRYGVSIDSIFAEPRQNLSQAKKDLNITLDKTVRNLESYSMYRQFQGFRGAPATFLAPEVYYVQGFAMFATFSRSKIKSFSIPNLTGVYGNNSLCRTLAGSDCAGEILFPYLTDVRGNSIFCKFAHGCIGITSVQLPKYEQGEGWGNFFQAFKGCPVEKLNLESLKVAGPYEWYEAFAGSSLPRDSSLDVEEIREFGCARMFSVNSTIKTFVFNNLHTVGKGGLAGCFYYCRGLRDLYFPKLKSIEPDSFYCGPAWSPEQKISMLDGCSSVMVHFPNNQDIRNQVMAAGGFGGTNTQIVFDM